MKRIPAWLAITQILLTALRGSLDRVDPAVCAVLDAWAGISKKRRRPAERGMRLWPLISVLSLIAFVGIFILCSDDLINRLGNLTGWSAALFLTTVVFAMAALASAISLWRAPVETVRRGVRRYSLVVTLALLHRRCLSRLLGRHRIAHLGVRRTPRREGLQVCGYRDISPSIIRQMPSGLPSFSASGNALSGNP